VLPALRDLTLLQEGVVSRRQVLAAGGDDNLIERHLRRRWAAVHPGVYVEHTGPLTRGQRAWAAVLVCWPGALYGVSALQVAGLGPGPAPGGDDPIHVAVDQRRRVVRHPGVEPHRVRGLAAMLQPGRSLPRQRLEHAALCVASASSREDEAVALLADAVQTRRTTPARLLRALDDLPRLARRGFLAEVLDDVASGAHSALERRYLIRVERRHRLPTAGRQRRVSSGRSSAYRDVEYLRLGLVVELDGRLGHEWADDRWRDLDRDVETALSGTLTIRLGWRQVLDECRTAGVVSRLLIARGWTGRPRQCSPTCSVTT
jgi:hypothetical protein